jgi:hypothetical protein
MNSRERKSGKLFLLVVLKILIDTHETSLLLHTVALALYPDIRRDRIFVLVSILRNISKNAPLNRRGVFVWDKLPITWFEFLGPRCDRAYCIWEAGTCAVFHLHFAHAHTPTRTPSLPASSAMFPSIIALLLHLSHGYYFLNDISSLKPDHSLHPSNHFFDATEPSSSPLFAGSLRSRTRHQHVAS